MNQLKRILGIVWMLLAPMIVGLMSWEAYDKINQASAATRANVILQWSIIILIFVPICIGLLQFGYYAFKGEYDKIPISSSELNNQ